MPPDLADTLYDASLYAGLTVLLALLSLPAPPPRRRGSLAMAAFALAMLAGLWLLHAFGAGIDNRTLHDILREALLALLAVAVLRSVLHFVVHVVLARFAIPSIVGDVLLGLSLIAYALVRLNAVGVNVAGIVTTSAVITGAIAFSAQEVLGALWAGLALQADRTIRLGDWIRHDGRLGQITSIRWRTTTVRTRNNELIVIPNVQLIKDKVNIVARPDAAERTLREVPFFVAYEHAPSRVVATVNEALQRAEVPNVAPQPATQCLCMRFEDHRIAYNVFYPVVDVGRGRETDSEMLAHVFAALQRAGMRIPMPQRDVFLHQEAADEARHRQVDERARALAAIGLFAPLTDAERRALASEVHPCLYARGDVLFRKGDPADSLFVLSRGRLAIVDEDARGLRQPLAAIEAPGYVGEMGLLTGQPRAATVIADGEVQCFRLDKAGFDAILRNRPEIVEALSQALARRQEENDATRQAQGQRAPGDAERGRAREIVRRIRQFFALGG